MSRLSHHANARSSLSQSRSQQLPSLSPGFSSNRDRNGHNKSGSQESEMQDYHVSLARSRPSSGHSVHSLRAPRTPPAKMTLNDSADYSPSFRDYDRSHSDVHNLRTGAFSFGRPTPRPTSKPGGGLSPAYTPSVASPHRSARTVQDLPALQARPPTPLEPQTTHIRAWLHRLETSINSIRHDFEVFCASTQADQEARHFLKDTVSSTLEACQQIPRALQTQHDDHAKSLTTELKGLLSQNLRQDDPTHLKKLNAIEQKVVDLELRIATSFSSMEQRLADKLMATLKTQSVVASQDQTAIKACQKRLDELFDAGLKHRDYICAALNTCVVRREQPDISQTSVASVSTTARQPSVSTTARQPSVSTTARQPSVSTPARQLPVFRPLPETLESSGNAGLDQFDSDSDTLSDFPSTVGTNDNDLVEALVLPVKSTAPVPHATYGNKRRRETSSLSSMEGLVPDSEATVNAPAGRALRKQSRQRAFGTKKRKKSTPSASTGLTTKSKQAQLTENPFLSIPDAKASKDCLASRKPTYRERKRQAQSSDIPIPTRFCPSRAAKRHNSSAFTCTK